MTLISKYFAGEDFQGFWIGVVESRQDPAELGRVKVRIFGVHNPSLQEIPSDDLPWVPILQGMNGKQFSTPKESDVAFGIWLDSSKQQPLMLGIIPGFETNPPATGIGFHDLRSEATIVLAPKVPVGRVYNTDGSGITIQEANTANSAVLESLRHPNADELNQPTISGVARYQNLANTVIFARKNNLDNGILSANNFQWSEPYPAYNPEYPYDNATVTESGHVFELDDTPGSERIHIAHRSGSYVEWFPTGTKVEKVTKSNYQIVMADDYLHVMGKVAISIDGDCLVRCNGDMITEVGGKMTANVAGDLDYSVGGAFNVQAQSINLSAENDATLIGDQVFVTGSSSVDVSGGVTTIGSDGDLNINAGADLNLEGLDLNFLADGIAAMTGASVGISGVVQIDGLASVNQGAPTASGAGSPTAGQSTGIPNGMAALKKNTGVAAPEEVPIPFNINTVQLDPITGSAYVQRLFLVPGANNTVANNNLITPDANTANVNTAGCMFDATTKTFLTDPSQYSISQNGLNLIESAEGFAKVVAPDTVTAFPDPATGGEPLTIGYGSTAAGIGQPVVAGMTISRAQALDFLGTSIESGFLPVLQSTITVPITQNMLDACLSLIYNIGPNNWKKSTVLKQINAQNWCAAGNAFLLWNKAAGKVLPGLTSRRMAERNLFLT
jgi:GH24 family phage-related lysozyme (muramidase)